MMRRPAEDNLTIIIGRRGSGKSQFAAHVLSGQPWDRMPYVIIDYKGEKIFRKLQRQNKGKVKELKLTDKLPEKPGLYILRPQLKVDDEAMEAWLRMVYERENIGLFVDEGYAVPNKAALDTIITQGRSKCIPLIILYQRPVWMTKFATAQADFYAIFAQNITEDKLKTNEYIEPAYTADGRKINAMTKLPKYHCLWYDVAENETVICKPAPPEAQILGWFAYRLNRTSSYVAPANNNAGGPSGFIRPERKFI